MFNETFAFTTLFSALFMALTLKFLHLFNFIKWSPIGWEKRWTGFSTVPSLVMWMILLLVLMFVFAMLYMLMFYLDKVPESVLAIFFSVLGLIGLEWFIGASKTPFEVMRSISIPLLSITAIVLRFIAGTAVFYKELSRKV